MKTTFFAAIAVATWMSVVGCASSSSSSGGGPVIDSLDVPETTTTLTLQGQTGPGVIVTLTAHDDDSGMNALHVVFAETKQDQAVTLPNNPTTVTAQKIELVLVGAPKGAHPVSFHVTDAKGRSSAIIDKTITVP